jgi:hypothetical protein
VHQSHSPLLPQHQFPQTFQPAIILRLGAKRQH